MLSAVQNIIAREKRTKTFKKNVLSKKEVSYCWTPCIFSIEPKSYVVHGNMRHHVRTQNWDGSRAHARRAGVRPSLGRACHVWHTHCQFKALKTRRPSIFFIHTVNEI